ARSSGGYTYSTRPATGRRIAIGGPFGGPIAADRPSGEQGVVESCRRSSLSACWFWWVAIAAFERTAAFPKATSSFLLAHP
ncbi:hypothetical protein, partial [Mycobacterium tuberculosis]|uniref:hypothetical protein n=1 Tax=Mycobacterium tuberculosis TaxID=1773 RepID=UPI0015C5157A